MVTYNLNGIPEEERMFDDEDEDITTVFDFYTFTSKEDFNTWYGDYGRGPQRKPVSYTYVSISEVRNRVWNQQYNEFVTYTHNHGIPASMPQSDEGKKVYKWAVQQRNYYQSKRKNPSELWKSRAEKLCKAGFDMDPEATEFEVMFGLCVMFKDEFDEPPGQANLPSTHPSSRNENKLKFWLSKQKRRRRENPRKQKLLDSGMIKSGISFTMNFYVIKN